MWRAFGVAAFAVVLVTATIVENQSNNFLAGVVSIDVVMKRVRRHGPTSPEREREADRRHCQAEPAAADCFRTYNGQGQR
jgi:hypothetical protein